MKLQVFFRKSNIKRLNSHFHNIKVDSTNVRDFNAHTSQKRKKFSVCILTHYHNMSASTFPEPKRAANSFQIKVTKMLLIVSTVFVCLNLPSYVMRIKAFLVEVSLT